MLAQRAKHTELLAARAKRAEIYPLLVARARQVLVQRIEAVEARVAQIALVLASVPRRACGVVRDLVARSCAAGDKPRGVGNDVAGVVLAHEAVDNLASGPRATGPRFQMQYHGGAGDKGLGTTLEWAADVFGAMDGRVEVLVRTRIRLQPPKTNRSTYCVEVAGRIEDSPALDTVVVGLPVMFMQPNVVREDLQAGLTKGMRAAIMREQLLAVDKVVIAAWAIEMARTLDPMLLQTDPGLKVDIAGITDMVNWRVIFVLNEGVLSAKVFIAAVAVRHYRFVVRYAARLLILLLNFKGKSGREVEIWMRQGRAQGE